MHRFWWPPLGLVLWACVQAPEQGCKLTVDKLILEMRQSGIEPEKNLKGQTAVDLRNLLVSLGTTVPANVDEALIFEKKRPSRHRFLLAWLPRRQYQRSMGAAPWTKCGDCPYNLPMPSNSCPIRRCSTVP
jgi:hypothetical protein